MRKKLMAGAAILALLMNSPQVKADDEIIIFGGEFEESGNKSASKKVEEPEPQKKSLPEEKPAPVEKTAPPEEKPLEKSEPPKPEVTEPQDKLPTQPLDSEEPAQITSQDKLPTRPLDSEEPAQITSQDKLPTRPLDSEEPVQVAPEVDEPFNQPVESLQPREFERPFANEWKERVEEPIAIVPPPAQVEKRTASGISTPRNIPPQTELRTLKQRFIKLAVDDTYIYYLDKNSVQWKRLPYSSSEYMADVWIRMIEREPKTFSDDMTNYGADNFKAQIDLAREQGYQYSPEDIKVLRQQNYVLEHYYLRPKTKQVQFLCELEVFGRPQNTINERAYDYKNWEYLVPGSVESTIYEAAIKILGKSKASERGHMTFSDMLDEYLRISL